MNSDGVHAYIQIEMTKFNAWWKRKGEATPEDYERAAKHFIIGAKLGDDNSLESVKQFYQCEMVSKEDFAAALRAHQAAVNETKSPHREAAKRAAREG